MDSSFDFDRKGLIKALDLLAKPGPSPVNPTFAKLLPETGIGETQALEVLAPFVMSGGHMTPGSTVANLTALWAANPNADIEQLKTEISAVLMAIA